MQVTVNLAPIMMDLLAAFSKYRLQNVLGQSFAGPNAQIALL